MTLYLHKTLIPFAKVFFVLCMLCLVCVSQAQFAPQAGMPGTTAIHRNSNIIKTWATGCTIKRGWQNSADTSLGLALVGDSSYVPGMAGNGIVSLGDGGEATVTFYHPISNGTGFDFVIFENGFIDQSLDTGTAFLELATVDVSSDGVHFFRFPSTSLTDTNIQIGSFAGMRAEKLNNLAGKYIMPFGTPFDLDDIPDTLLLNKNAITHVRIKDVVGSIDNRFATYDEQGNKINDPWPTPFASSGFDLDAVGVIHPNYALSITEMNTHLKHSVSCYPNPATSGTPVNIYSRATINDLIIFDQLGKRVNNESGTQHQIVLSNKGIYIVVIHTENGTVYQKLQIL